MYRIARIVKIFRAYQSRKAVLQEARRRQKLFETMYPEDESGMEPEDEHPPGYDPEPGEAEDENDEELEE